MHLPFSADFQRKGDVQDSLTLSPGQAVTNTLVVPATALMDKSQIVGHIKNEVDTFMEVVPVLVNALDEVAKVHPFISGANLLLLWT